MKKSQILWILTAVILFINIIFYWFRFGGDNVLLYVSDFLPVVCSLIASVSLFMAFNSFKGYDFAKISWLMLFIGVFLFFLGETLYAILEVVCKLDMNENFPSIADIAWCTGYIPQFIALSMLFIGYKKSGLPMGNVKMYISLSVVFIILCASIIYYLLIPIIDDPETDILTKIFSLFYPIADLFLVAPAIVLMYVIYLIGRGRLATPWLFIALGFISFTVADLLYSYLSWLDIYGNGNFIDMAWHAGYLLIGLSAMYQKELLESLSAGAE